MNNLLLVASIVGFTALIPGVIGTIKIAEWLDKHVGYPAGAWFAVFVWGIVIFLTLTFAY